MYRVFYNQNSMLIIFLLLLLIFPYKAWSLGSYTLDKIVVRSGRVSFDEGLPSLVYSLETFTADDIKKKNLDSLVDLLDYISGVDLRYRGVSGIQGDLSLRGSTYEQVAVFIDGVRVVDPQTGHHNLDIPLTVFDIEKVEVMKEGSSGLYGAGALAGSINIITKKPTKKSLSLDTLFGEHALFGQTVSFSLAPGDFSSRVSVDHRVSSGGRTNTDFDYKTCSFYLSKDSADTSFDTLFGYQKKDFGADSFYSDLFPEEEEHTETLFARVGSNSGANLGFLKNNLFFRKHRDKFILRRNNPTFVNYHTTYVYGLGSQLNLPVKYGIFLLGIDTARDEIYSTNLGKHAIMHQAGLLGFIPETGDRLNADFRFRFDIYEGWGLQKSFNLGIGYNFPRQRLKIKGSAAGAFRIPSFTELYYSDPANRGNPDLGVEKSDSLKLGLNFMQGFMDLDFEFFYRKGRNLIDWTRISPAESWIATNLGEIDFCGIEFNSTIEHDLNLKVININKFIFSYNYTDADKKTAGFYSKYALDILKHQFLLTTCSSSLGMDLSWQLSYNQRYYGQTYFVANLCISKKIIKAGFILEPFLKIDNLSNTEYSEVAGVLQPGRWVKSGFKFEW